MVKSGGYRNVWLIGRLAIKTPRFEDRDYLRRGIKSNKQEIEVWRHKKGRTVGRVSLCPLLFYLPWGWLNVMQRAEPLFDEDEDLLANRAALDMAYTIFSCGEEFAEDSYKKDAYGLIDGKIILVDYGGLVRNL